MADNVNEPVVVHQSTETVQPDFKTELAQQMALSLNGGMPPASTENSESSDVSRGIESATSSTDGAGASATTVASNPFDLFKEKFGYDTPEAAVKDIEDLRAFRAAPRPQEFQVPDDESAAFLRAIAKGDRKEVWQHLDREMRLESLMTGEVTKETAADIVKMGMQLKYKDLTPDEINYRFGKQFSIPPKPAQNVGEEDAEYQERISNWQDQVTEKQMDLMIEAKLTRPDLEKARTKFSIPDIETPTDEGYIQYKKMLEEKAKSDLETKEAYKSLTPKAIETKINFNDEANKIAFEFHYEPDAEGFSKAVETACDADKFWQTFTNSDGSPNRQLFLDAIYYANNKDKIIMAAINQGKNAAIKASLPDNTQGGLVRQIAQTQEPSELDKQMRASLKGYGGY